MNEDPFVRIMCRGKRCNPLFVLNDASKPVNYEVSFLVHDTRKSYLEDGWKIIDGKVTCPKCQNNEREEK